MESNSRTRSAAAGASTKENPRSSLCDRPWPDSRDLVRGSFRRIMIMRFRPANISLINRRHYLPRLRLTLSSFKRNDQRTLTGHYISGKTVFHLVAVNTRGEVVVRKKCSRTQVLRFTSKLRECLMGMEAGGGAHFLGRALREQGHDVRLMPAQYVKPYVKTNKSDYIDAEAIAEAVTRPSMRFVPIKSDDQLDLQSLHRVRERWVVRRTAVINQIRIAARAWHHDTQGTPAC